jgi:hypothetical protein
MSVTLNLTPEIEAGLAAHAAATGMTVERYLQKLVEKELAMDAGDGLQGGSGMVRENGLLVYRTGKPLPTAVVDDAIRRSRDERARHLPGGNS